MSEERITRMTLEEALLTEGETDWDRLRNDTSEPELDEEEIGMVIDWSTARMVYPEPKSAISMRLDPDIIDFFKARGKGYQTRINAVLRMYVEAQKKAGQ